MGVVNRGKRIANSNPLGRINLTDLNAALTGDAPAQDDGERAQVPAIEKYEDGTLRIGAFWLSAKGLVVQGDASVDDWWQLVGMLSKLEGSLQWLWGDALAYGERAYGTTYQAVAGFLGLEVGTLYTYAWLARQVDFSIRIEKLSVAHHRLVATLPPEHQREWLQWAASQTPIPSISQMKKAMYPPALPDGDEGDVVKKSLFSQENITELRKIAKLTGKAQAGNGKARQQVRGWISEQRRMLDELDQSLEG